MCELVSEFVDLCAIENMREKYIFKNRIIVQKYNCNETRTIDFKSQGLNISFYTIIELNFLLINTKSYKNLIKQLDIDTNKIF